MSNPLWRELLLGVPVVATWIGLLYLIAWLVQP